jgi:hypothetical protein
MTNEKIVEFYIKFLKGSLDINGVKIIPYKMDSDNIMYFKVDNPDDVSYSEMSLKGWITESLDKFYNFIGIERDPLKSEILGKSYYMNDELTNELHDFFKSVNQLFFYNYNIEVEHLGLSFYFIGDNSFLIENYVKPIKASIKLTNGKFKKIDLNSAVERYKEMQKHGKYDETEENYLQIDTILDGELALIDSEWMVEYVVTKFEEF